MGIGGGDEFRIRWLSRSDPYPGAFYEIQNMTVDPFYTFMRRPPRRGKDAMRNGTGDDSLSGRLKSKIRLLLPPPIGCLLAVLLNLMVGDVHLLGREER